MTKRYQLSFELKKTIEEAQTFCDRINAEYSAYMRKHNPAHFTTWTANDGSFDGFICWYKRLWYVC